MWRVCMCDPRNIFPFELYKCCVLLGHALLLAACGRVEQLTLTDSIQSFTHA